MAVKAIQCWGLTDPQGTLWPVTFRTRKDLIARAATCCIGADDYRRYSHDSPRWAIAYRNGYRIVRVTVSISEVKSGV
jgi:hypothetical protein